MACFCYTLKSVCFVKAGQFNKLCSFFEVEFGYYYFTFVHAYSGNVKVLGALSQSVFKKKSILLTYNKG